MCAAYRIRCTTYSAATTNRERTVHCQIYRRRIVSELGNGSRTGFELDSAFKSNTIGDCRKACFGGILARHRGRFQQPRGREAAQSFAVKSQSCGSLLQLCVLTVDSAFTEYSIATHARPNELIQRFICYCSSCPRSAAAVAFLSYPGMPRLPVL